jgi:hypothetical protein
MTDTSKATTRPWCAQQPEEDGVFIIGLRLDEKGNPYDTPTNGLVAAALPWPTELVAGDMSRCEANAAIIVKAVNSYDVMLEALKSIAEHMPKSTALEGGASAHSSHVRAADKVRAAIALAEST